MLQAYENYWKIFLIRAITTSSPTNATTANLCKGTANIEEVWKEQNLLGQLFPFVLLKILFTDKKKTHLYLFILNIFKMFQKSLVQIYLLQK